MVSGVAYTGLQWFNELTPASITSHKATATPKILKPNNIQRIEKLRGLIAVYMPTCPSQILVMLLT